jgi:phage N-6-adenine-methyltransferase
MTDAERSRRYRKLAKKRRRAANFEWYTPPDIIALAVETMGGIDCDPASCVEANQVVGAKVFYTLDDDGLKQEWYGRVFLNPPYSKISSFVAKLVAETAAGRVTEFILLTANSSDSAWFQKAAAVSSAICFPARRIKFISRRIASRPLRRQLVRRFSIAALTASVFIRRSGQLAGSCREAPTRMASWRLNWPVMRDDDIARWAFFAGRLQWPLAQVVAPPFVIYSPSI